MALYNVEGGRSVSSTRFVVMWCRFAIVALIGDAGIVLAKQVTITRHTSELVQVANQGHTVLVAQLTQQAPSREVTLPGEIHGYYETPIYSRINGYVKAMLVDKGAVVKAGQLVAIIESPETDQQVRNSEASYQIAAITDRRYQAQLKEDVVVPRQDADTYHATMLESLASWKTH